MFGARSGARAFGSLRPRFEVIEERVATEGFLAVRTAIRVHLDESEVESDLQLGLTVGALNEAGDDAAGLEWPVVEDAGDIEIHGVFDAQTRNCGMLKTWVGRRSVSVRTDGRREFSISEESFSIAR